MTTDISDRDILALAPTASLLARVTTSPHAVDVINVARGYVGSRRALGRLVELGVLEWVEGSSTHVRWLDPAMPAEVCLTACFDSSPDEWRKALGLPWRQCGGRAQRIPVGVVFVCTRPVGHIGPCTAMDADGQVQRWPRTEE